MKNLELSDSSCKINHLLRNPVSGGRPPSESVVNRVRVVNHGAKFIIFLRSARLKVFKK